MYVPPTLTGADQSVNFIPARSPDLPLAPFVADDMASRPLVASPCPDRQAGRTA